MRAAHVAALVVPRRVVNSVARLGRSVLGVPKIENLQKFFKFSIRGLNIYLII